MLHIHILVVISDLNFENIPRYSSIAVYGHIVYIKLSTWFFNCGENKTIMLRKHYLQVLVTDIYNFLANLMKTAKECFNILVKTLLCNLQLHLQLTLQMTCKVI